MSKPVILTGLRANNDLHIGNYFGALLPLIDMAKTKSDEYDINLFVPDLHSFTTPIDHSQLQAQILHNLKLFVAAGLPLDNPNIHIYRQSYIPAHSELAWILDCFTGFGEMSRMTQFKDKAGSRSNVEAIGELSVVSRDASIKATEISAQMEQTTDPEEIIRLSKLSHAELIKSIKASTELIGNLSEMIDKEGKTRVGLFNYPVLMAADILLYSA